jgi:hypothetical protein
MRTNASRLLLITGGLVFAGAVAFVGARQQANAANAAARQAAANQVAVDADDIGGVVTSTNGPEAGVWVIAETTDLPTTFRREVVTDDQGRYVVPDLPKANYKLWVRGYGLVDSQAVTSQPGQHLALTAIVAPNAQAAAQVYPANYWYSLLQIPPKDAFPMTVTLPTGPGRGAGGRAGAAGGAAGAARGGGAARGAAAGPIAAGEGIPAAQGTVTLRTQAEWIEAMKQGCELCHQMGTKATREIPPALGVFDSSIAAWDRRIQVGQTGGNMLNGINRLGHERAISMFADWTDRIKGGEVPQAPPRPQGVERNVVVTLWDFGRATSFPHDVGASDHRTGRANAWGPVMAGDWSLNILEWIDPVKNEKHELKVPLKDEADWKLLNAGGIAPPRVDVPSPYWGDEVIWTEYLSIHNPWFDSKGNFWFNAVNRAPEKQPEFCKTGSTNPFAAKWPIDRSNGPQLDWYDPKTGKFGFVNLCFSTHHIQFGFDKDDTLYFSGAGQISWVKTKLILDNPGDPKVEEKAQGWCPAIIDSNGDGKIGAYTRTNEPPDAMLDRQIQAGGYGIATNPKDGSVWFASTGPTPGKLVRIQPGANPPDTCIAEVYEPPFNNPKAPGVMGFNPRGVDVDTNGLVWTALAGSAQMASFDRSKCKVLNGPTATGQHCPEGWALYPAPGPKFKGVTDNISADFFYYNWVDRHNTLGYGENMPIATGTGSDSLLLMDPATKQWVTLRVPYPLGFYTRGLDGRIDDPTMGWKGRGLWAANEARSQWHSETGKGQTSYVAHFQLRPNPLAK